MRLYEHQPSGTVAQLRQLRRNATEAEKRLLRALKQAFPTRKWRFQAPIGPYRADILCFAERLVIEVDGGQHAAAAADDARRTRFIESQGFRVLRFWNNDGLDTIDGVIAGVAGDLSSGRVAPSPSQPSAGPLPLPKGEGSEVSR